MCARHALPVIEDGFEEEMTTLGRPVLPLMALAPPGRVTYVGTFSKVLFPGVRVGWIASDRETIEGLTALRHFSEIAPALPLQAGLATFCARGCFDRHVALLHRAYRRRMQRALRTLREQVAPAHAAWTAPVGGFLLWLRLAPPPDPAMDLVSRIAAVSGVRIRDGADFFPCPTPGFARLSISGRDEPEIAEGISRLGRALAEIHAT